MTEGTMTNDERESMGSPATPPPPQHTNLLDEMRAKSGAAPREIVPWWVLASVFAVVWLAIVYLMLPPFPRELTRFMSLYHQNKRQYEQAIPHLERLLKWDLQTESKQGLPTTYSELGNAWMSLGDYDKGIEYFSLAQENKHRIPVDDEGRPRAVVDFNTQIGYCHFRKGDLEKAEEFLKKGLEFDKLDRLANFTLGEIAFQRGDMTAASDRLKMVARAPGYAPRVEEYYQRIEEKLFAGLDDKPVPDVPMAIQPHIPQPARAETTPTVARPATTPAVRRVPVPVGQGARTMVSASNAATVTLEADESESGTTAPAN